MNLKEISLAYSLVIMAAGANEDAYSVPERKRTDSTRCTLSEDEKAYKKGLKKYIHKGEIIYYSSKKSLQKKISKIDKL